MQTIIQFIRQTANGFQKVSWFNTPDGKVCVKSYVQPTPQQLQQIAANPHNEIILNLPFN